MIMIFCNILIAARLSDTVKTRYMLCSAIICFPVVVYCILFSRVFDAVYVVYLLWLMTISYVDYITGYVYRIMEYMATVLISFGLLLSSARCHDYYRDPVSVKGQFVLLEGILGICIGVAIFIMLILFLGKLGCIGLGDVEILFVVVFMMTCRMINTDSQCIINGSVHAIVSVVLSQIQFLYIVILLFILRYRKSINFRRLRLDRSRPFVPSIYMAAVIDLFIQL